MAFYHGTGKENLESILKRGLRPRINWDSLHKNLAVVSLTDSASEALIEAYVVDETKIELGEKKRRSKSYVALEIDTATYKVIRHQADEWWIAETIKPKHINVVAEEEYLAVKRRFEKKCGE